MKRTDERLRRGCFAAAAFVFLFLAVRIIGDASIRFMAIKSAFSRGDMICGINETGLDSDIFLVSAGTGTGSFIRRPHLTDRGVSSFEDPYITPEGKPCFTERLIREDGSIVLQKYTWDPLFNRTVRIAEKAPAPAISLDQAPEDAVTEEEGQEEEGKEEEETQAVGHIADAPASEKTAGEEGDADEEEQEEADLPAEAPDPEKEALRAGGPVKELYDRLHGPKTPVTELEFREENGAVIISLTTGSLVKTAEGVHRPLSRTAVLLCAAALAAVFLYKLLLLIWQSIPRAGKIPWLMLRISFLPVFLTLFIMPGANELLRSYLYAYGCRNVLFHCADAAARRGRFVDTEMLEEVSKQEFMLTPDMIDTLFRSRVPAGMTDQSLPAPEDEKSLRDLARSTEYAVVYRAGRDVVLASRSVNGEDSIMFVPDGSLHTLLDRIFADGRARSYISILSREKYAEVFLPLNPESEYKILIGARMPVNGILYSLFRQRIIITRTCLFIGLLMLAAMLVTVLRCLKPLSELAEAVASFAGGDLSARAEVKGHNEISLTAICFNEMADTLEKQSAGAESYRRFYEAFVPATLLRRFSGRPLSDALQHGNGYRAAAFCMSLSSPAASSDYEALFESAIRSARNEGGHLASLTETGIKLVFAESAGAALRTAVALEQTALRAQNVTVPVGLSEGPVRLYVAGSARRKSVADVDSGEAAALCRMAQTLKIPVILTEDVLSALDSPGVSYHFRCLGRMGNGSYVPERLLYELLDADRPEMREAKERTGKIFEHGIRAYAEGDYFTARNDMIRVMEDNPDDLAARSYILNCDRKEPPAVCQTEF